ncbi:MAG: DMT family transporter [Candidatus Marinimicrobia bacterium]|jgi:drug/metabolite transporter (DMT)-like permease|nr:DMT family transporter [Candidatus Neomarinimicrobiota bacterium]MDD5708971.1 DMT family transporter [Candidatus Neomarinimicrobiota bacterium]MDX9777614.1 DMT family transporter [bacterium]
MDKHKAFTLLLIVFQALIVGLTNIAAKQAALEIDPFVISFFRYLLGTAALGLIVLLRKIPLRIDLADFKMLFLLMLLGQLFNQVLFAQALRYTVPSHPPMIYALTPIVIIFIDIARKAESASRRIMAASLLSLTGVAVVLGNSIWVFNRDVLLGDTLVFLAMICWSFYTAFSKPYVHKYGSLQLALILIIMASIVYAPWGIYRFVQADLQPVTWKAWLSIAFLGIFSSGMSYLNYFAILRRIDPSRTGLIISTHPPATIFFSVLLGFEALRWNLIAGSILIIFALGIARKKSLSKIRTPEI